MIQIIVIQQVERRLKQAVSMIFRHYVTLVRQLIDSQGWQVTFPLDIIFP